MYYPSLNRANTPVAQNTLYERQTGEAGKNKGKRDEILNDGC